MRILQGLTFGFWMFTIYEMVQMKETEHISKYANNTKLVWILNCEDDTKRLKGNLDTLDE